MSASGKIEKLLHDGAQRHGMPVETYRERVQSVADRQGVSLLQVLEIIQDYDEMTPEGRSAVWQGLLEAEEMAQRLGIPRERLAAIWGIPAKGPPQRLQ